jgi:hypothetical protein
MSCRIASIVAINSELLPEDEGCMNGLAGRLRFLGDR